MDKKARAQAIAELRKRAEKFLKEHAAGAGGRSSDSGILDLIHELEVYQVELELQNEELRRVRQELEDSRNKYYDFYASAPVGFITLDSKGLVSGINRMAAEILGTSGEILIGQAFSRWILSRDHQLYFACLKRISELRKRQICNVRLYRKDGNLLYVRIEAGARYDKAQNIVEWHLALSDITRPKLTEQALRRNQEKYFSQVQKRTAELKQRAEQLARLSSQLILAEQRERRRLSLLVHDHIQQMLVGIKIHLEILAVQLGNEHRNSFDQVFSLLSQVLSTARSLSAQMAPYILYERGLAPGLEWLVRNMRETYQLNIDAKIDPGTVVDQEDLRVLLFQSTRELLFNVLKHAGTSTASIKMFRDDADNLLITVSDRGVGFDPDNLARELGCDDRFGLFSIRERFELIGGRLEVESSPGNGAVFTLILPQTERASSEKADAAARPAGSKIRVLLTDDHGVLRQGLASLLRRHSDIEVIGEAADGVEAVNLARRLKPDVILMDVKMPGMDGIEATRAIQAESPRIRIVALSMYDDAETAKRVLDAGAVAIVPKSGAADKLLSAIRGGEICPDDTS